MALVSVVQSAESLSFTPQRGSPFLNKLLWAVYVQFALHIDWVIFQRLLAPALADNYWSE
jgi:hypothetical protein